MRKPFSDRPHLRSTAFTDRRFAGRPPFGTIDSADSRSTRAKRFTSSLGTHRFVGRQFGVYSVPRRSEPMAVTRHRPPLISMSFRT